MSSEMKQAVGLEALDRLNGGVDAERVRESGRFVIPGHLDQLITFDLARPFRSRETLIAQYWHAHPRYLFFKGIIENAKLVDVGAGSGAMIGWRTWNEPDRSDIVMSAVDMFKGEYFDMYADYDVVMLGSNATKFPGASFDAAIVSHLIEHVNDREGLAREIFRICKPGAKVYVEWPSVHSADVVGKAALEQFGVSCSTVNFFDDGTHLVPVERSQAEDAFKDAGFSTITSGEVMNDFLFPELFSLGYAQGDSEVTTYALWLALRFSQYLVLEKL